MGYRDRRAELASMTKHNDSCNNYNNITIITVASVYIELALVSAARRSEDVWEEG